MTNERSTLAQFSGVIEAINSHNDEVDPEYIIARFNDTLDDNDVESDIIRASTEREI